MTASYPASGRQASPERPALHPPVAAVESEQPARYQQPPARRRVSPEQIQDRKLAELRYNREVSGRRFRTWRTDPTDPLTLAYVAKKLGVSTTSVQNYENRGTSVLIRAKIAAAFGLDVEDIWPDAPETRSDTETE